MEKRLRNIYRKIDTKPELQQTAQILRTKLFNIELKEAQGAKIRGRLQFELEGEKCTKSFFQKITKRKHANQDMLSIKRIKDSKTLTKQTAILDEVKNFYANLYSKNSEQELCGCNSTNSSDST